VKVRFKPAAKADVDQIHAWYLKCGGSALARRFRLALRSCSEAIGERPGAYPRVHLEVRRALLKRFPYAVFYVIEPDTVVVLGCFHGHRDPCNWRARLEDASD